LVCVVNNPHFSRLDFYPVKNEKKDAKNRLLDSF